MSPTETIIYNVCRAMVERADQAVLAALERRLGMPMPKDLRALQLLLADRVQRISLGGSRVETFYLDDAPLVQLEEVRLRHEGARVTAEQPIYDHTLGRWLSA